MLMREYLVPEKEVAERVKRLLTIAFFMHPPAILARSDLGLSISPGLLWLGFFGSAFWLAVMLINHAQGLADCHGSAPVGDIEGHGGLAVFGLAASLALILFGVTWLIFAGVTLSLLILALLRLGDLAALFRSFVSYEAPEHPGVWQSPSGSRTARTIALLIPQLAAAALCASGAPMLPVFGIVLPFLPLALAAPLRREATAEESYARTLALREDLDPRLKESIVLGSDLRTNRPVLIDRATLGEHMYLRGAPGSGKTSALADLCEQILSFPDTSLHFFDLKGDTLEILEAMRTAKERATWPLELLRFIDRPEFSTHTFNLFDQSLWSRLTPRQRVSLLGSATSTSYGGSVAYGPGWFGSANAARTRAALDRGGEVGSFEELSRLMTTTDVLRALGHETKRASEHAVLAVSQLAEVPPLNAPSSIDLAKGFRQPQACYWSLAGGIGYETSGAIARLALSSLLTAANQLRERRTRMFVILDEAQFAVGHNLEQMLQTARSMGIGVILSNQYLAAFRAGDIDLKSAVLSCCRTQWAFSVSDPQEIRETVNTSGEALGRVRSRSVTRSPFALLPTVTQGTNEVIRPWLAMNELLDAAATPGVSVMRMIQDTPDFPRAGRPFLVQRSHHISRAEYERRKAAEWPSGEDGDGTITPAFPEPKEPAPVAVPAGADNIITTETVERVSPSAPSGEKSRRGSRRRKAAESQG